MLAPIYGSVIKILNRWTQTLADRLDASISSRAAASTALSNATWTNTRAGKLDSLDAAITSRAPASTALSNATWTDAKANYLDAAISTISSPVRSIQTGTVDTTTTTNGTAPEANYIDVTISSVTVSKCFVVANIGAGIGPNNVGEAQGAARLFGQTGQAYLLNSTTLRIHGGVIGTYRSLSGRWTVIEYK